jgi:hypothetical protein
MTTTKEPEINYQLPIDEPEVNELFEPEVVDLATISEDDLFGITLSDAEKEYMSTTWQLRQNASKDAERLGFDAGAVVTLRDQLPYSRVNPANWGFVITTVSYTNIGGKFAPIRVNWQNDKTGYYWPDELILVMFKPDDSDLQIIRTGQA